MPVFQSNAARQRWIRRLRRRLFAAAPLCFYCGKQLRFEWSTVDHEIPTSRGGPDEEWNALLACGRCNRRKGSRPIGLCVCQLRRGAGLFAFDDAIRRGLVDPGELTDEFSKVG
jgi:5-methylcytosine-specific restriction endonuclease McrA